jgi:hypothetical protein
MTSIGKGHAEFVKSGTKTIICLVPARYIVQRAMAEGIVNKN